MLFVSTLDLQMLSVLRPWTFHKIRIDGLVQACGDSSGPIMLFVSTLDLQILSVLRPWTFHKIHIDGLVQACGDSSALTMESRQCCTPPSIWYNQFLDRACSMILRIKGHLVILLQYSMFPLGMQISYKDCHFRFLNIMVIPTIPDIYSKAGDAIMSVN